MLEVRTRVSGTGDIVNVATVEGSILAQTVTASAVVTAAPSGTPDELAFTGASSRHTVPAAVLLVLLGLTLIVWGDRRSRRAKI